MRRPPRGVPKAEISRRNFYDLWLPELAPSAPLVALAQAATTPAAWTSFVRKYRAEMKKLEASRLLDLLSAFSKHADFAVGCYCKDEARCHRSVLRQLLAEHGAIVEPGAP